MKYVAYDVGNLRWSGGITMLKKDASFDDDHPIVQERPELFTDEEPGATFRSEDVDGAPHRIESTMVTGPGGYRSEKPIAKAPPRNSR